jgi:hypothetical protein
MPNRAAEFMRVATQVAYSRMYAGVHFPSDVAAGAKLGSTIASYECAISNVRDMQLDEHHAVKGAHVPMHGAHGIVARHAKHAA